MVSKKVLVAFSQKLKCIYENGDTEKKDRFLCFPQNSSTFISSDLALLTNPKLNNLETFDSDLNTLFEFSHQMNIPIKDVVSSDTYSEDNLWTVYGDIINNCVMVNGTDDPILNENYKKARELLYDDSGEFSVIKPIYEQYNKCRDDYYKQEESCGLLRASLENAESDDERKEIAEELEKSRQELRTIQQDWLTIGHKLDVEKAIKDIELYASSHPDVYRKKLIESFDKDLDTKTNGDKGSFAATYLFPSGFEKEAWDCIVLSGEELKALYENAPIEIKSRCTNDIDFNKIEEASLEYRSVRVERPWLNTKIFDSRSWYFPQCADYEQISYADDLTIGKFPAYISAILMYRNLKIEYKKEDRSARVNEILARRRVVTFRNRAAHPGFKQPTFIAERKSVPLEAKAAPAVTEAKTSTKTANVEETKNVVANNATENEAQVTTPVSYENVPVSVLSYICKKLPDCPNPDPSANWSGDIAFAKFTLVQNHGGKLKAFVNSTQISNSFLPIGTKVKIKAYPDGENGYVIRNWRINGEDEDSATKEFDITISNDGNQVEMIWDKGADVVSSFKLSNDQKTITSWQGADERVIMDRIAKLSKVETIEKEAFKDNSDLKRVGIGSSVKSIESYAFTGCNKLEVVDIPESTTIIDPNAFRNKFDLQKYPHFTVAENNPAYTTLFGHLVEKRKVVKLKQVQCMYCGFSAVYKNEPKSTRCPHCNREMSVDKVSEISTLRPDYYIPAKIDEATLMPKITGHVKGLFFALSEFKEKFLSEAQFQLVYIPLWKYDISTQTNYSCIKKIPVANTSQNAQNQTTTYREETKQSSIAKSFDNLIVPSTHFTQKKSNYKISSAEKFNNEIFNQKAFVENISKDAIDKIGSLQSKLDTQIELAAKNKEGNQYITSMYCKTEYANVKYESILYPIWTALVEFEGKAYRAIVDANQGTIDLDYPKDPQKIIKVAGIAAAIILVIAIITLIFK